MGSSLHEVLLTSRRLYRRGCPYRRGRPYEKGPYRRGPGVLRAEPLLPLCVLLGPQKAGVALEQVQGSLGHRRLTLHHDCYFLPPDPPPNMRFPPGLARSFQSIAKDSAGYSPSPSCSTPCGSCWEWSPL